MEDTEKGCEHTNKPFDCSYDGCPNFRRVKEACSWRHVADLKTKEFFHLDEDYNIWSCDCKQHASEGRVSLCLSQCTCLKKEGELRDLKREIAQKRKELGLLLTP